MPKKRSKPKQGFSAGPRKAPAEEVPPEPPQDEEDSSLLGFSPDDHIAKIAKIATDLEIVFEPDISKAELIELIEDKYVAQISGKAIIGDRAQIPTIKTRDDFLDALLILFNKSDYDSVARVLNYYIDPLWNGEITRDWMSGRDDDWKQIGGLGENTIEGEDFFIVDGYAIHQRRYKEDKVNAVATEEDDEIKRGEGKIFIGADGKPHLANKVQAISYKGGGRIVFELNPKPMTWDEYDQMRASRPTIDIYKDGLRTLDKRIMFDGTVKTAAEIEGEEDSSIEETEEMEAPQRWAPTEPKPPVPKEPALSSSELREVGKSMFIMAKKEGPKEILKRTGARKEDTLKFLRMVKGEEELDSSFVMSMTRKLAKGVSKEVNLEKKESLLGKLKKEQIFDF